MNQENQQIDSLEDDFFSSPTVISDRRTEEPIKQTPVSRILAAAIVMILVVQNLLISMTALFFLLVMREYSPTVPAMGAGRYIRCVKRLETR